MSEIPEDIDRIATDIVRMPLGDDPEWETYKAVAQAILAERKRCVDAVLAEKLAGEATDPTDISYNVAIDHAHAAIWRVT